MSIGLDPFPADGLDTTEENAVRLVAATDTITATHRAQHKSFGWSLRGREHYALWMAEGMMIYALGMQRKTGGVSMMEAQLSRWIEHLLSHHSNMTGRKITWGVRFEPHTKGEKDDAEEG